MSAFDDWTKAQMAAMSKGVRDVARDAVADVGNTYQAFLMGDAGWRVPRAGHYDLDEQQMAVAASLEQDKVIEPPENPAPDLDYA